MLLGDAQTLQCCLWKAGFEPPQPHCCVPIRLAWRLPPTGLTCLLRGAEGSRWSRLCSQPSQAPPVGSHSWSGARKGQFQTFVLGVLWGPGGLGGPGVLGSWGPGVARLTVPCACSASARGRVAPFLAVDPAPTPLPVVCTCFWETLCSSSDFDRFPTLMAMAGMHGFLPRSITAPTSGWPAVGPCILL